LKDEFNQVWDLNTVEEAQLFLKRWTTTALKSRLEPIRKFVRTVRKHVIRRTMVQTRNQNKNRQLSLTCTYPFPSTLCGSVKKLFGLRRFLNEKISINLGGGGCQNSFFPKEISDERILFNFYKLKLEIMCVCFIRYILLSNKFLCKFAGIFDQSKNS